jgi:hypothetical protein
MDGVKSAGQTVQRLIKLGKLKDAQKPLLQWFLRVFYTLFDVNPLASPLPSRQRI